MRTVRRTTRMAPLFPSMSALALFRIACGVDPAAALQAREVCLDGKQYIHELLLLARRQSRQRFAAQIRGGRAHRLDGRFHLARKEYALGAAVTCMLFAP